MLIHPAVNIEDFYNMRELANLRLFNLTCKILHLWKLIISSLKRCLLLQLLSLNFLFIRRINHQLTLRHLALQLVEDFLDFNSMEQSSIELMGVDVAHNVNQTNGAKGLFTRAQNNAQSSVQLRPIIKKKIIEFYILLFNFDV